jgi:hypothetical protein
MTSFHRFGAINEPGTCLWCGKKLPYWIPKKYAVTPTRGYLGTGHFCTLTCAFLFADFMVELGHRLEKK